jgi:hypothetical protein
MIDDIPCLDSVMPSTSLQTDSELADHPIASSLRQTQAPLQKKAPQCSSGSFCFLGYSLKPPD